MSPSLSPLPQTAPPVGDRPSVQKSSLWRVLHIQTTKLAWNAILELDPLTCICPAICWPSVRQSCFSAWSRAFCHSHSQPLTPTFERLETSITLLMHFVFSLGSFMSQAWGQLCQCPLNILCAAHPWSCSHSSPGSWGKTSLFRSFLGLNSPSLRRQKSNVADPKPCGLYKWMTDSRVCLTLVCLLMLELLGHLISFFLKLIIVG